MRCNDCDHGFECCHQPSVRHADGTTECSGDGPCALPHGLHVWVVDCDEVGCACGVTVADALPLAA